MSVVKGLKNINALLDKPKYENDGPKLKWLKLADGQSVKIRFIEELDEESANYEIDTCSCEVIIFLETIARLEHRPDTFAIRVDSK